MFQPAKSDEIFLKVGTPNYHTTTYTRIFACHSDSKEKI